MGRIGMVLGVTVAVVAVLALVAGLALYRPDIPYARLEAKYAGPTSKFAGCPAGCGCTIATTAIPPSPWSCWSTATGTPSCPGKAGSSAFRRTSG